MKKSKFDSMNEKEIVIFLIDKAIDSLSEEVRDKKDKEVKIKGELYSSENEIMDAYGCGSISRSQMEKALEMFDSSWDNERKLFKVMDFLQSSYEFINDGFDGKLEKKK